MPAAAQWLLIAGSELYRLVDDSAQTNVIIPSDLYDDETPGLQKQRWDLWKARLSWVQEQATLNDQTKAVAKQAHAKMRELEKTER